MACNTLSAYLFVTMDDLRLIMSMQHAEIYVEPTTNRLVIRFYKESNFQTLFLQQLQMPPSQHSLQKNHVVPSRSASLWRLENAHRKARVRMEKESARIKAAYLFKKHSQRRRRGHDTDTMSE